MSHNISNLKFKLKDYTQSNIVYNFELSCPLIIDVFNDFLPNIIGFQIKNYFKINNNIFYIKYISIDGINMTSNKPIKFNNNIIHINSDPIFKHNLLYIKKFNIYIDSPYLYIY